MAHKITRPRKGARGRGFAASAPDYELKDAGSQQKKRRRKRSPSPDQELHYRMKRRSKRPRPQKRNPAAISIDIPKEMAGAITKTKEDYFKLTFPIGSLDGLQRLAWGLDLRARSIIVCLKFPPKNNKEADHGLFCVHSSTDSQGKLTRSTHQFCSTKSHADHAIKEPCTSRCNILTIILNRALYSLLGKKSCRKLDIVHDAVDKIIKSDPTKSCLICEKAFNVKIYTPTACLGKCMDEMEKWPLRARLSHLLSDVKSLDFLLCSIYSAVDGQTKQPGAYKTDSSLLVGCPLELTHIKRAIDSFPALSDTLSMSDMLSIGNKYKTDRRRLLSWLSLRFRGCMVSLSPDSDHGLKGLDNCYQFMVLNARLERQEKFTAKIDEIGVGTVAFHGCIAERAFNILTDALRDPATLPYMRTDRGVFFSSNPSYSYMYTCNGPGMQGWKNSMYKGTTWGVIFGIEVAQSNIAFRNLGWDATEFSTRDESLLMIRYVLLVPHATGPPGCRSSPPLNLKSMIDQNVMKKAFKNLSEGTLCPQHMGMKQAPAAMQDKIPKA